MIIQRYNSVLEAWGDMSYHEDYIEATDTLESFKQFDTVAKYRLIEILGD